MFISKVLLILLIISVLTSCSTLQPAQIPAKPAGLMLTLHSAANLNPNVTQRSSPVYLTIMQLKNTTAFKQADYFSLAGKPEQALGNNLISQQRILVTPKLDKQILLALDNQTHALGITAAFTHLNNSEWRQTLTVDPTLAAVTITLSNNTLTVKRN